MQEPTASRSTSLTGDRPRHIGIVGGGQLARMLVQAASPLDLAVTVLATPEDSSVRNVWPHVVDGQPNRDGIAQLSDQVDVVTVEHELVDLDALRTLDDAGTPTRPNANALLHTNKAHQRVRFAEAGLPVPPFVVVEPGDDASVDGFARDHGWPIVAKVAHGGYDGRGVEVCADRTSALDAIATWNAPTVLEPLLALDAEFAVVAARSPSGEVVTYPLVRTVQEDGICVRTENPSGLDAEREAAARQIATDVAAHIDTVGIIAVELFDVNGSFLINEIALRPHNTGHWTIDACPTSQFENHLRAVADLPLGPTEPASPAVMVNVLGPADGSDPRDHLSAALASTADARADVSIHLYGKAARPGRKLGHVTAVEPAHTPGGSSQTLALAAESTARILAGGEA